MGKVLIPKFASAVVILLFGVVTTAGLPAQQLDTATVQRGLLRANLDTTCAACTDFYQFANGGWMASHTVPPTESMWGIYARLIQRNQAQLLAILEEDRADTSAPAGSTTQKLGAYYGSCMDSAGIDAAGLQPLQPLLNRISALRTSADVKATIAALHRHGVSVLFGFGGAPDVRHTSQIIATAAQGGLGLPNRDYYTRTDPKSQDIQSAYVDHVAHMLELAGEPAHQAQRDADVVMALETKLAQASMTNVQQRDPNATYHKMPLAELQTLTPDFNWEEYLKGVGARMVDTVNVRQPDFFRAMDAILDSVPVATWRAYMTWHVLDAFASALPTAFVDEDFRYSRNFSGLKEMQPRWRRCLSATSGALSDALGKQYVARYFTPETKVRALAMVNDLQDAFRERIEALTWMSPATKKEALVKLAAMTKKIGYPDKWDDYAALHVDRGPFAGNLLRVRELGISRNIGKIGKPADRGEWGMYAFTMDASANWFNDEIVFPAGFLQPPLFDPTADDAVNYGAMGATIGHEMTHLFDNTGRQFDSKGNLRDWWTPEDAANYKARAQRVIDQFNAYTILGDSSLHVNGELTLGENIADLGGLKIAYIALEKALARNGRPGRIDGFSQEQRFFLSWAQFWRQIARPEFMRARLNTDPHAPWKLRVNGPLSNMPEFAKAFNCKPGEPMVRPDSLRAEIW